MYLSHLLCVESLAIPLSPLPDDYNKDSGHCKDGNRRQRDDYRIRETAMFFGRLGILRISGI